MASWRSGPGPQAGLMVEVRDFRRRWITDLPERVLVKRGGGIGKAGWTSVLFEIRSARIVAASLKWKANRSLADE